MATTYAELITEIIDYAADDLVTEARARTFISFCEQDLNNNSEFRILDMQRFSESFMTAGDPFVSLPDNFLEMDFVDETSQPAEDPLTYESPSALARREDFGGPLSHYSIIGGQLRVFPAPGSGSVLQMAWYERISALSDANTTNWLLTRHPSIYLYGSLVHAEPFLANDGRIATWQGFYESRVSALIDANEDTETTGGTMVVSMPEQVA